MANGRKGVVACAASVVTDQRSISLHRSSMAAPIIQQNLQEAAPAREPPPTTTSQPAGRAKQLTEDESAPGGQSPGNLPDGQRRPPRLGDTSTS